ncbi:TPA: hypothetical protein JRW37_003634 [Salmonella enterica subsp. enterica serovar Typhimurium]|nr:hypothetical protein [Salmonella enterica subsp. enterica serovar Typhimurium]
MAKVDVKCPFCAQTASVKKYGPGSAGHQHYRCQVCCRSFQVDYEYLACQPGMKEQVVDLAMYTAGIRNPQGLAINPWSGALWLHEHGPRGGDEINIPEKGKNYGWPLATWGVNYSGLKVPEAKGEIVEGTAQPVYYWKDSPAISGMAFYASDVFAPWRHKLFIGALKDKEVIVMRVDGNTVTEEGRILGDRKQRIYDVRVGPDGYLYVLTDESDGQLLKVSPAATR